jgi:hypothetical protein
MYITLTNAAEVHRGNKIAINSDVVVTVYDSFVEKETGILENVTYIFCPPHGTWEVTESLETVVNLLNNTDES